MVELNKISNESKSLDEAKRKRKKIKKDYLVGLNKERTDAVKKYLKRDKKQKVSFSELMDYLLKQFYNQFRDQIENKTKGDKS